MNPTGRVVRGNEVSWKINFFDSNNAVITANSAHIVIRRGAVDAPVSGSMTPGPDGWTYTWDSSNTRPGVVNWYASCEPTHAAEEGSFYLEANPANPGP